MKSEFIELYQAIQQNRPVVAATVISSAGSTPRTVGSKMLVYVDGARSGTIGGGAIEADVIKQALRAFTAKRGTIASCDLRRDGRRNDLDLVCGGSLEILLEHVDICPGNTLLYAEARNRIAREQPFLWKVVITEGHGGLMVERSVEELSGTADAKRLQASLDRSCCGLVFDDRPAFASAARFPDADGVHVCETYVDIFTPYGITQKSCIIIVTRGHSHDREVLGQALRTPAGYFGMMGSRKKGGTIYSALLAQGFVAEDLGRVRCPIGMPIKAETPAELAVSIAAELIEHRASQGIRA